MRKQRFTARSYAFGEPPPKGVALSIGGQRYDLVDVEPYRKQDGEEIELAVWMASCRGCGQEFLSKAPRLQFPETRNCADCRSRTPAMTARWCVLRTGERA